MFPRSYSPSHRFFRRWCYFWVGGMLVFGVAAGCTVDVDPVDTGGTTSDDTAPQEDTATPSDGDGTEDTRSGDTAGVDGDQLGDTSGFSRIVTYPTDQGYPSLDACPQIIGHTDAKDQNGQFIGQLAVPENYPFTVKKIQYFTAHHPVWAPNCHPGLAHKVQIWALKADQDKPPAKPSQAKAFKEIEISASPRATRGALKHVLTPVEFGTITLEEGEKLFVAIEYVKIEEESSSQTVSSDAGTADASDGGAVDSGMDSGTTLDTGVDSGGDTGTSDTTVADSGDAGGGSNVQLLCPGSCGTRPAVNTNVPGITFESIETMPEYKWADLVSTLGERGHLLLDVWGTTP